MTAMQGRSATLELSKQGLGAGTGISCSAFPNTHIVSDAGKNFVDSHIVSQRTDTAAGAERDEDLPALLPLRFLQPCKITKYRSS